MPKIGNMMSVGKQAMANSQTALQTTSHNVANSNTEGFSRQRVEFKTNEPVGLGNLRIGQGVKAGAVTRVVDNFLNKQIQEETSKMGASAGRDGSLGRVEQVFNESINKGLNRFLATFFNAFREFANNPESQATRALVKESGRQLVEDFHRIHNQLNSIQKDVDFQITAQCSQINSYVKEIAALNEKIRFVEVQGVPANDERDRRELLVKKLGELVNIRYGEGDNGKVTITAGNTGVLVSGGEYNELIAKSTPPRGNKRESNVDVFFQNGKNGSQFVITDELKNGHIGGALDVRDNTINELHNKLDSVAYTVALAVNTVHEKGFDRYDNTGRIFFENLDGEFNAAEKIKMNEDIVRDPGNIASALKPGSPGDNRVANAIAGLQSKPLFNNGTATVDDVFNGMVGEFAVVTQRNKMLLEHQKSIVDQLNNIHESVSGVSLDEETTDMVKFQKAFDASARIIKVADEMFETVLALKRL